MLSNQKLTKLGLTLAILVLGTVGAAQAEVVINDRGQDLFTFTGCDEDVTGLLDFHFIAAETLDAAGGQHLSGHIKLHGFAEGEDSGARYRVNVDYPFAIFANRINDNAGGAFNGGVKLGVNLIGLGKTPDLHVTLRLQVTENANGELVMDKAFETEHGCD